MRNRMLELIPMQNFIVLEVPEDAKSTIIKPETVDKKNLVEGTDLGVVLVGPKCKKVQIGDHLVVPPQAIVTFPFEGKTYFLTREDNCGCIIREKTSILNSLFGLKQRESNG